MTLQIELPPDVEARYAAEARAKGVPLERHLRETLIENAPAPPASNGQDLQGDAREHTLQELFETFDGGRLPSGVSDRAFHRENWYE